MSTDVFFGGAIVAAAMAGTIALFAPCCISVMLPAYLASSFQNRRLLIAMTFVFGAGIATIMLPLALGVVALRRLITEEHTTIYVGGGLLLGALAAFLLLGGRLALPVPGPGRATRAGPLGVYSLGLFSGVASACCAPVLAGVLAVSGIASSFALALGLGTAYVFGMVAPLFVMALVWERVEGVASRLFRPRSFTWRLGPLSRTIPGTNLAGGLLLALMGGAAVWIGLAGETMPASGGWQTRLFGWLQGLGSTVSDALSWVPGWVAIALLVAVVVLLVRKALRQTGSEAGRVSCHDEKEAHHEHQDA